MDNTAPVKIFISYSSVDIALKTQLKTVLHPLVIINKATLWDNYQVDGGGDWEEIIHKNLLESEIVLLLFSSDSMASKHFLSEVKIAIARHEKKEAVVIPVILRPCGWNLDLGVVDFSKIEALPEKGKPVVMWNVADEAFESIFRGVLKVVNTRLAARKDLENEALTAAAVRDRQANLTAAAAENERKTKLAADQKRRDDEARLKKEAAEKAKQEAAEAARLAARFDENMAAARQYLDLADRKNARRFVADALQIRPRDAEARRLSEEIEAMTVEPSFFEKNWKWLAATAGLLVLLLFGWQQCLNQPQKQSENQPVSQPLDGSKTAAPTVSEPSGQMDVPKDEPKKVEPKPADQPKTEPTKPAASSDLQAVLAEIEASMVSISGGTFEMGDTFGEGEADEKPVYSKSVSGFSLSKFEVKQSWYKAVMDKNPSNFKGDNLPVEQVSWDEAKAFIQKLNGLQSRKYRLPTEAEWEFAARERGKKIRFGNGNNTADPSEINFDGRADYKKDFSVAGVYRAKTVSVGSFSPNGLGLYNMSGNVWEWCEDIFGPYPGNTTVKSGSLRVYRGGSWRINPELCRAALRYRFTPTLRINTLGFRLASSPF